MFNNESRAVCRAIETIRKALAGESYESAVKICGGKVYDDIRDICAKLVEIADAFAQGAGTGGGGGGGGVPVDVEGAIAAHNTDGAAHSAQFNTAFATMTSLLSTLTKTAPQIPSSQAGTIEYNHVIITPNADNTDVSLSVTHNTTQDRLPYEILCYPIAGTTAAIGMTFTLKKIGDFWYIKSLNTFLYRNSSAITQATVGIYAVNGLTGAEKAPVINAIAWYVVGQISGYPQLLSEGTRTGLNFDTSNTNTTGANLQNFFINNTV